MGRYIFLDSFYKYKKTPQKYFCYLNYILLRKSRYFFEMYQTKNNSFFSLLFYYLSMVGMAGMAMIYKLNNLYLPYYMSNVWQF